MTRLSLLSPGLGASVPSFLSPDLSLRATLGASLLLAAGRNGGGRWMPGEQGQRARHAQNGMCQSGFLFLWLDCPCIRLLLLPSLSPAAPPKEDPRLQLLLLMFPATPTSPLLPAPLHLTCVPKEACACSLLSAYHLPPFSCPLPSATSPLPLTCSTPKAAVCLQPVASISPKTSACSFSCPLPSTLFQRCPPSHPRPQRSPVPAASCTRSLRRPPLRRRPMGRPPPPCASAAADGWGRRCLHTCTRLGGSSEWLL